jgi:polyhydroxyalkanoate synthesis regulator phasin
MIKVLLILSAVVMLVATVFAYQNGQQFAIARNAAIAANKKVDSEVAKVKLVSGQVAGVAGDIARVQQEADVQTEKKKAQQLRIAQADSESKRVQEALDEKNKKLAELRIQLAKLPQGMKPETLVEDINTMKKAIADLSVQADAKKKEVDTEELKVAEARKALDEIVRKIEERKKSFDRNSLTASIVAVNTDWGFVVIDGGQNKGITEATKLLVTRGNQIVGKLSIISVEGNRTVANILPETLAKGMSIAPGDRVILENLYQ